MPTAKMKTNVIDGYGRVSKVAGRKGDSYHSPVEQEAIVRAWITANGYELGEWIIEEDVSGKLPAKERRLETLIERAESGKSAGIVTLTVDRLTRGRMEDAATIWRRLEVAGARFVATDDGIDSTAEGSELFYTLHAMMARQVWKGHQRRWRRSKETAVLTRGIHTASHVPTGYTRDPESKKLVPNEYAPLMKGLFERRAEGASLGSLVTWFVDNGGSALTNRSTISGMLSNRAYVGTAFNGELERRGAHPAIISQRLFDAVQGKEVPREHTGKAAASSLLGGIVRCEGCGRRMGTTQNGRKQFVYRCNYQVCSTRATCMTHELDAEVVERLLTYWRVYRYSHMERTQSNQAEAAADLADARENLADLQHLLDKWQAGKRELLRAMTAAEYADDLLGLKTDVEEARLAAEMAESIEAEPVVHERVADLWDTWTHETKKEWLGKNLETVIVRKSGRGRGNPVHVSERMAVGLKDGLWLHRKAGWSTEPFSEPHSALELVTRRRARKALRS